MLFYLDEYPHIGFGTHILTVVPSGPLQVSTVFDNLLGILNQFLYSVHADRWFSFCFPFLYLGRINMLQSILLFVTLVHFF